MDRRLFTGLLALGATAGLLPRAATWTARAAETQFDPGTVIAQARELAAKSYKAPPKVQSWMRNLTYDQYRDIRFKPEHAIWRDDGRGFAVDLLQAGFVYGAEIELSLVEEGVARKLQFDPAMFDFGPQVPKLSADSKGSLSGFRLRAPVNTVSYLDEFAVFQGASYFRAIGQGQNYGLSARGLALRTADPKGEEFPVFTAFWIERPPPYAKVITVHALLDSASVAGAYRFRLIPGETTLIEVDATLFPRADMDSFGLAPLTSMFLFGEARKFRVDDFREAVHDSDGLLMRRRNGEQLWRPLANPRQLQLSAFADRDPVGFGLMQRARRVEDFQDLEARYDLRPSAWVAPKGNWGIGQVVLVEIPSERETNDNVVAFWKPAATVEKGGRFDFGYWLSWGPPVSERSLAWVEATRTGLTFNQDARQIVIDFVPASFGDQNLRDNVQPKVWASKGRVEHVVGHFSSLTGRYRLSFVFHEDDAELIELGAVLENDGRPLSETWLYKWTRG